MTNLIQVAIDALALGSLYALTALGIGLIFGVMRLINFAHGDFIMIGGYALIVPSTAANGAKFNMTLGSRQYLIQRNWVNAGGGYCATQYP